MATKGSKEEKGYIFTREELADFKRFWESEVGKKYMKKIKDTKEQLLDAAMGSVDESYVFRSTGIANGFQSVIIDIESMIRAFDDGAKKEETAEKKDE